VFLLFGGKRSICLEKNEGVKLTKRLIFLSISDFFEPLERPPVQFNHDKHVEALKQKGCSACHPKDQQGNVVYIYPRVRNEKTKKSLMNSYHHDCIGCHSKLANEGKKTGPVTCGECHAWENTQKAEKVVWPDAGFDYYLHNLHADAAGGDCGICHHTGDMTSCRNCHGKKDGDETLSFRKAAHISCIQCHLEYEAGPSSCKGCHSGLKRTIAELADIPHPDVGQPEKVLLTIKDARMNKVPFNHKSHEGCTSSCRDCHHESLESCKNCHTLRGDSKGDWITLANAYHEKSSDRSCIGCHETKKSEALCAGCHSFRPGGMVEEACIVCHRGSFGEACDVSRLEAPDELLPEDMGKVIEISILEKEYLAVKFPHYLHIKKLTEVSNENKLSRCFHYNSMTVCMGCHHLSPMKPKAPVPSCSECHSVRKDSKNKGLSLLGAYHRQCLGCHKEMKTGPTGCNECHAQKVKTEAGE
ncbi:MAG: hypothetical protein DRG25_06830, partial [Deltaproteobacteria bacterium]